MEMESLINEFEKQYGSKPEFYVRAPGRVNLIGEHIDYSGYAVLPMALNQAVWAVVRVVEGTDQCVLKNTDPEKYCDYTFKCGEWAIDPAKLEWYHYFLCGHRGMMETLGSRGAGDSVMSCGFQALIRGDVPPSAGLSSSSALVCCAAMVTLRAVTGDGFDEETMSRTAIAEACASYERYIGTMGGGMDQAICLLAKPFSALLIEFSPLRSTNVTLPPDARFVVAHSGVKLNKAAGSEFNERVVECRLAAKYLAKKAGHAFWKEVKKLGDAQKSLGLELSAMADRVKTDLHSEPYAKADLMEFFEVNQAEFDKEFLSPNTQHMTKFKLFKRALHCFTEAGRVIAFHDTCVAFARNERGADDTIAELGALMDASHDSCSRDYECSCPELDELVGVCRQHGAVGSRLTGAGWAGCTVSLVRAPALDNFLRSLKDLFYSKTNERSVYFENAVFVTSPAGGAEIVDF